MHNHVLNFVSRLEILLTRVPYPLSFSVAALCGVVMYNYIKVKDVRASQLSAESIPERLTKVSLLN